MATNHFEVTAADWRKQIRRNTFRTRVVILIFILLYLAIGLLIDIYMVTTLYPGAPILPILTALITFKITPYATLITSGVAIISLFITYALHDRIMLLGTNYHEVKENAGSLLEKQLYNVVEEIKIAAGIRFMPRIFIIDAPYMNAFASGYSERSAMMAITQGLLNKLTREELQAVMAHELSHIRHQDIKLTLTASVLSNIMLIIIDFLFFNVVFGRRRGGDDRLYTIILLLRYLLPIITVFLILYLSRTREYMADSGCVELMRDNEPLARALLKIDNDHQQNKLNYGQIYEQTAYEDVRRAAYLYDPISSGIRPVRSVSGLFDTHPSIAERLLAIGIKLK